MGLLFNSGFLRDRLEDLQRQLVAEVDQWNPDQLLAQSEDEIVQYLADKYTVEPIELHSEDRYADEPQDARMTVESWAGRRVNIPTTRIVVHIPFSGDRDLMYLQPSTYSLSPPIASVGDTDLVLTYEESDPNPARIQEHVQHQIQEIGRWVTNSGVDVRAHNERLGALGRAEVQRRKTKLLADRTLASELNIPIRKRADAPPTPVPVHRRRVQIELPAQVSSEFRPEYAIDESSYEEAIRVIVGFGRQLERTPRTTAKLDEEELRDLFLGALNTQFEGQGGGEMFNGSGKTDILIRVEDRNVFIAECKFWTGQKDFGDAIDQLLSYLIWRDSKAALMVFIRNKDATVVIEKAVEVLRGRASRVAPSRDPSERSDFVLLVEHDPAREIRVALLPFVLRSDDAQ